MHPLATARNGVVSNHIDSSSRNVRLDAKVKCDVVLPPVLGVRVCEVQFE